MRHLYLLRKLLGILTVVIIVIVAILGNLEGLARVFPQIQGYLDILQRNAVSAPVLAWLAVTWLPNWAMVILAVVIIALYQGAFRALAPIYWPQPKILFTTKVETRASDAGPLTVATLEAYNQEDQPISDCVATLETATNLYGEQLTPVATIRNNRLRWVQDGADSDCRMVLPKSASRTIAVAETIKDFRFSSCKPSSASKGLTGMYLVRIRVDGRLRGTTMDPQYFDGYLYVEESAGQSLTMIFGKSDWKKDKRLRKLNRRGLFSAGK